MITKKWTESGFIPYSDADFERDYPRFVDKAEIGRRPSEVAAEAELDRKERLRLEKLAEAEKEIDGFKK